MHLFLAGRIIAIICCTVLVIHSWIGYSLFFELPPDSIFVNSIMTQFFCWYIRRGFTGFLWNRIEFKICMLDCLSSSAESMKLQPTSPRCCIRPPIFHCNEQIVEFVEAKRVFSVTCMLFEKFLNVVGHPFPDPTPQDLTLTLRLFTPSFIPFLFQDPHLGTYLCPCICSLYWPPSDILAMGIRCNVSSWWMNNKQKTFIIKWGNMITYMNNIFKLTRLQNRISR